MLPAGFIAKKVETRPQWLNAQGVADLYSVSGCLSEYFCDYVRYWKHNGFWLFDNPAAITEIAAAESIDLSGHRLFYYEVYEQEFDADDRCWRSFEPEKSFTTHVEPPGAKRLEGYDVVTFSAETSPECSPLSCNSLAQKIPVNAHCLLPSLEDAIRLLEAGAFDNAEPGPYRIFAVYSCDAA